jgi:hypothetical protein
LGGVFTPLPNIVVKIPRLLSSKRMKNISLVEGN